MLLLKILVLIAFATMSFKCIESIPKHRAEQKYLMVALDVGACLGWIFAAMQIWSIISQVVVPA